MSGAVSAPLGMLAQDVGGGAPTTVKSVPTLLTGQAFMFARSGCVQQRGIPCCLWLLAPVIPRADLCGVIAPVTQVEIRRQPISTRKGRC